MVGECRERDWEGRRAVYMSLRKECLGLGMRTSAMYEMVL